MTQLQKIFRKFLAILGTRSLRLDLAPPRKALAGNLRYKDLWAEALEARYAAIDALEEQLGFAVDQDWLAQAALSLQVSIKESRPNWQHGRLLYALTRARIASLGGTPHFSILETGTSAGFSSLCLAKALVDGAASGHVITIDALEHDRKQYWNKFGDEDGQRTRRELLAGWKEESERIIFLAGFSSRVLSKVGIQRIHLAFLDGSHFSENVLEEYEFVKRHQVPGDLIIFDDVTPGKFDGIVSAVRNVSRSGYEVRHLESSEARGYAIATRIPD